MPTAWLNDDNNSWVDDALGRMGRFKWTSNDILRNIQRSPIFHSLFPAQSAVSGLWGEDNTPRVSKSNSLSRRLRAMQMDRRERAAKSQDFGDAQDSTYGTDISDVLAQLQAMQDPSRYMMDDAALEAQARAAANAQYNPLIQQLRDQMQQTRSGAERDKVALGQMFGALADSISRDVPVQQEMYNDATRDTRQQYKQLEQDISGQYKQSQQEQEELMKRLNIEAAAPGIFAEQQDDRDFFVNMARTSGQTMADALGQERRGAVNFTRSGSQIARSEGTTRQADLMEQLREALGAYRSQIGAHKAARESAYIAGLGDLRSQAQSQAMDRAQQNFMNYIRMIDVGRSLRNDQFEQAQAMFEAQGENGVDAVKSPADVAGRALGMGLNRQDAQDISNVFMTALGSNQAILSGVNEGGFSYPKEALANQVVEQGRNAGLSSQELNALRTIALEYFGRR